MRGLSPTLCLGVANLIVYVLTYALASLGDSYHLSKDFPDGVVLMNMWMVVGSPLLSLVTIAVAVREYRQRGGDRPAFLGGVVSVAAAVGISTFAIVSLLRPR